VSRNFAALPVDAILDGELVALGEDGWPYFPLVCQRLLNGDERIRLVHVIFDLLEALGAGPGAVADRDDQVASVAIRERERLRARDERR